MRGDVPVPAGLLPTGVDRAVIGFACASGATVFGEDVVAGLVRSRRLPIATSRPYVRRGRGRCAPPAAGRMP